MKVTTEIKDSKWIDRTEFNLARDRVDCGNDKEWVVPNTKTVARFMMEEFFKDK